MDRDRPGSAGGWPKEELRRTANRLRHRRSPFDYLLGAHPDRGSTRKAAASALLPHYAGASALKLEAAWSVGGFPLPRSRKPLDRTALQMAWERPVGGSGEDMELSQSPVGKRSQRSRRSCAVRPRCARRVAVFWSGQEKGPLWSHQVRDQVYRLSVAA